MALPITVPFTFGNATTTQSLSSLDADFSTVYNAVNGIGNGTVSLANVSITGGSISANSLSTFGNLTFTGTGNRITGDFSTATYANRVMFQNSVTNGRTNISALPNGTSTIAGIDLYGSSSDPANNALFRIANTNAEYQFEGTKLGTGTYLPMTFYTGGSERMRIDSSGNVGIGLTAPAYNLHVRNGAGNSYVATQYGTGTIGYMLAASNEVQFKAFNGTNDVMTFATGASERMRIDSSGNVGIGTSSPSASAILDAQSTTKGLRFPNMTTTQKNAISSPAAGLVVFDTTLAKLCVYSGSAWQTITSV
jgi:hypothetical protein